jgi:hypothetical protein
MDPSELIEGWCWWQGCCDQHSQCVGMERCSTFASPLAYALWAPALHSCCYVQLPPQAAGHGSLKSYLTSCCAVLRCVILQAAARAAGAHRASSAGRRLRLDSSSSLRICRQPTGICSSSSRSDQPCRAATAAAHALLAGCSTRRTVGQPVCSFDRPVEVSCQGSGPGHQLHRGSGSSSGS